MAHQSVGFSLSPEDQDLRQILREVSDRIKPMRQALLDQLQVVDAAAELTAGMLNTLAADEFRALGHRLAAIGNKAEEEGWDGIQDLLLRYLDAVDADEEEDDLDTLDESEGSRPVLPELPEWLRFVRTRAGRSVHIAERSAELSDCGLGVYLEQPLADVALLELCMRCVLGRIRRGEVSYPRPP